MLDILRLALAAMSTVEAPEQLNLDIRMIYCHIHMRDGMALSPSVRKSTLPSIFKRSKSQNLGKKVKLQPVDAAFPKHLFL